MSSSGQLVYETVEPVECDGTREWDEGSAPCEWSGDVDVLYDPESDLRAWTCPECGTEHEESLRGWRDDLEYQRAEDAWQDARADW